MNKIPEICKECFHASIETMFNNFDCSVEDYGIEIENYNDHIEEVRKTNKCKYRLQREMERLSKSNSRVGGRMREKKVKTYGGFVIAEVMEGSEKYYKIYDKEEWVLGEDFRYEEWETGSIEEAKDFIDSY